MGVTDNPTSPPSLFQSPSDKPTKQQNHVHPNTMKGSVCTIYNMGTTAWTTDN